MNPPAQDTEADLSDGERDRLQAYADSHGLSLQDAATKAMQDALMRRLLPSRRATPATVTALSKRLSARALDSA